MNETQKSMFEMIGTPDFVAKVVEVMIVGVMIFYWRIDEAVVIFFGWRADDQVSCHYFGRRTLDQKGTANTALERLVGRGFTQRAVVYTMNFREKSLDAWNWT